MRRLLNGGAPGSTLAGGARACRARGRETLADECLKDWDEPGVADGTWAAICASIDEMSRTSGSGVAMCHAQRKTAVYLSDDGKYVVEHTPDGTIIRTPLAALC